MTEKERLLEAIIKELIPLQEMAITKNRFEKIIENNGKIALFHLIYCLVQPNSDDYNHWKGEIYGNFSAFDILKYNKKYPSEKDFFYSGMDNWFERFKNQMKWWVTKAYQLELGNNILKYEDIPYKIDLEKVSKCCIEYFNWLINNVDSKTGTVDQSKVYNKIDELVKQYNS